MFKGKKLILDDAKYSLTIYTLCIEGNVLVKEIAKSKEGL